MIWLGVAVGFAAFALLLVIAGSIATGPLPAVL